MIDRIIVAIAAALFEILVSATIRWVARKMHITRPHDRALRWLEDKRFRPPPDALTEKEIIVNRIVKSVDSRVIPDDVRKRIQGRLAHWGLIRRQWDHDLSTPLALDWKKCFVRLGSLLAEIVVPRLNAEYTDANIACFAILPFPRGRKHRPTEAFEQAFERCLGARPICREFLTPGILERKIAPVWISQLGDAEKILVLQPVAMDDDYLQRALEYIKGCSVGSVHEVVTLLDGSGRSVGRRSMTPPERVLMELDLSSIRSGESRIT